MEKAENIKDKKLQEKNASTSTGMAMVYENSKIKFSKENVYLILLTVGI